MATVTPLQLPENLSPAKEMIVIVTDESNKSYAVRLSSLGWPYNPALDLGALTVRVNTLEGQVVFLNDEVGGSGGLTVRLADAYDRLDVLDNGIYLHGQRLNSFESGLSSEIAARTALDGELRGADEELMDFASNLFNQCVLRVCEPVPVSPITINPAGLIEDQSIPYPGQITPGSFWRDALGIVHLQGYYRVPQLVNVAAWVCEIPQQYAPANGLVFCVGAGSGTFVLISPDGRFYVHRTNWTAGAFVAFSQISYRCKGV